MSFGSDSKRSIKTRGLTGSIERQVLEEKKGGGARWLTRQWHTRRRALPDRGALIPVIAAYVAACPYAHTLGCHRICLELCLGHQIVHLLCRS